MGLRKRGAGQEKRGSNHTYKAVHQCVEPVSRTHTNTCPGEEEEAARNVALNSRLAKAERCQVTAEGSLPVVGLSKEMRTSDIKDSTGWKNQKMTMDVKGQLNLEIALNFG